MSLFVDTCVWSLAFRRSRRPAAPEVSALEASLVGGDLVFTTGLVLQELLQGFHGPKAKELIVQKFARLPFIVPDMDDHVEAADLRNLCRRRGVQVGTIDALIAQLCIKHGLQLLTTDGDFQRIAKHTPLQLFTP